MSARNPVLLIHGIDDTAALLNKLRAHLQGEGFEVHALDLTPNNGNVGLDRLAEQIHLYASQQFGTDVRFDLVGFSMGGVVSRFYVQRLGGIHKVQRLVTISSPHCGTVMANLRWNEGVRQMRPGSNFLRDLNADCHMLEAIRFTSIWTPLDLMILPAKSSVLPIGKNIRVMVPAHALMVKDLRVARLVVAALLEEAR